MALVCIFKTITIELKVANMKQLVLGQADVAKCSTNKGFSSISTKFNPYFSWCVCLHNYYIPAKVGIQFLDVLESILFVHTFGYVRLI